MAPWNWRNPCTSAVSDSDESSQTPPSTRKLAKNENFISAFRTKNIEKSGCAQTNTDNSSNQNQQIKETKSTTPVLFSTNRGLYLRVPKSMSKSCVANNNECLHENATGTPTTDITDATLPTYGRFDLSLPSTSGDEISFCDLERWSTNRANTICLEDTFIVTRHNDSLPDLIELPANNNNIFTNKIQRSGSIFCVPSGSRHALLMPHRNVRQRSTSIQSTFERFGVH
ncbi:uncharacterized protein LOC126757350 [Bactrocera neohumeralis]|uniref:uncharacterized protein LOC120766608 n=1 Tax=Bactrocera tryoni TaxID=59916 RepID=UPI001A962531|nr:uncharacterized protein LOC120766608 [Bactrocera tryoni]XP_050327184.1 uncharacterized protein LOC126757350 [Bactrocera neohumeralis]